MQPRKDDSKKAPEPRKDERKPRFQIVKLEERIAPHHRRRHYWYPPGWYRRGGP
jgi:hypothetical protein